MALFNISTTAETWVSALTSVLEPLTRCLSENEQKHHAYARNLKRVFDNPEK